MRQYRSLTTMVSIAYRIFSTLWYFSMSFSLKAIMVLFQRATYEVLESAGSVEVCINVLGILERPATITIVPQDGSATSMWLQFRKRWSFTVTVNTFADGDDYTFVTMELPLIQRSVSQCFPLTILSDDILETSETFQLMLSTTDDNVLIGVSSSLTTITILNDDGKSHWLYTHLDQCDL